MLAVETEFCGNSSRIPTVKAEVIYECDSKHQQPQTAAGPPAQLAVNGTSSSSRPVLGQWEEATRLLGLRWATYGAQLP